MTPPCPCPTSASPPPTMATSHSSALLRNQLGLLFPEPALASQTEAASDALFARASSASPTLSAASAVVDELLAKLRTPHVPGQSCCKPDSGGDQVFDSLDSVLTYRRAEAAISRLLSAQDGVRQLQEVRDLDRFVLCVESLASRQELEDVARKAKSDGKKLVRLILIPCRQMLG